MKIERTSQHQSNKKFHHYSMIVAWLRLRSTARPIVGGTTEMEKRNIFGQVTIPVFILVSAVSKEAASTSDILFDATATHVPPRH